MTAGGTDARPLDRDVIFEVATLPARLLGRLRPDLRASLTADRATFAGSGRWFFVVLASIAVAYPIVASVFHVIDTPIIIGDPFTLAVRPFWDVVFAESLPFMLAVALIGAYSPALGVLLVMVLVPADLVATYMSPPEFEKLSWQIYPPPIFARLISYGLLWLLAVEIPLFARVASVVWTRRAASNQAPAVTALVRMAVTTVLTFFWAMALPWLIQPVFVWSALQLITPWASAPTWVFWWILVVGATLVAGAAAVWPRPVGFGLLSRAPDASSRRQLSMTVRILRQLVAVLIVSVLLAGLMSTALEAAILTIGLLIAGPVLTPLMARVPVPERVALAPFVVRWVAAMAVGLAIGWVLLTLAGDAAYTNYFVLVVAIAVAAPVFRIVLDAGVAPSAGDVAPGATVLPSAGVMLGSLALTVFVWLGAPGAAFANNCPALDELATCIIQSQLAHLAMFGAALGAIGGALRWGWRQDVEENPFFGPPTYTGQKVPEIDTSKLKKQPPPRPPESRTPRNRR